MSLWKFSDQVFALVGGFHHAASTTTSTSRNDARSNIILTVATSCLAGVVSM